MFATSVPTHPFSYPVERELVGEFEMSVTLSLPREIETLAMRAINLHLIGFETVPLDSTPAKKHVEANHNLLNGQIVQVKVKVYSDGHKEFSL